jgi:diguanylate cyclase (GGDEF)-like protein
MSEKFSPSSSKFSVDKFLTYGPLVVLLMSFYTINLLNGGDLPPFAYLLLGLVLTVSGVFGMHSHSYFVLATVVGGELACFAAGISSAAAAIVNSTALIAAAAAVPIIVKGKVVALTASHKRLSRQQVEARLKLGQKITLGVTSNPADTGGQPVANTESLIRNVLLLAKKSIRARTAQFCWYNKETDALVPVDSLSDCDELLTHAPVSLKEGRLAGLKKARDHVTFRYEPDSTHYVPLYKKKVSITSVLAVPISFKKGLVGAFVFDKDGPDPFFLPENVIADRLRNIIQESLTTERRLKSAVLLSEQLRQINEAARQFTTARTFDQVYDTAVRYAVGLTPFCTAVLAHRVSQADDKYEIVGVNRKQMTTLLGKNFELKSSLCGLAFRNRTNLPGNYIFEKRMPQPFGPDVGLEMEEGERCMVMPLMVREEAVGFLLLAESPKPVDRDDLVSLHLFAEYCAVSLLNAEANKELERMATSDPLTGIPNHRAFRRRIVEANQRAIRGEKPMSVLFVDIDHFKVINDTYGHSVGDSVLKKVASSIHDTVRQVDFAARYGGEEFVVILEDTGRQGALIMAERLRQRIGGLDYEEMDGGRNVTASIGIATYPADTASVEELIALADAALYRAKNDGRNCCKVA